jgi:hypothetical protein
MDDPAQQPPPTNPPGVSFPDVPVVPQEAALAYEETPIITVNAQPTSSAGGPTEEKPKKRSGSCLKTVGIILLVVLLFAGGIWLSSFVRQYLPSAAPTAKSTTVNSAPTPSTSTGTSATVDPYATWKLYSVISGFTKLPIPGLQFKLPPDVLSPICDGASCVSQGTYLPGGTRLTVAPRGTGQSLRDFRGTVITDANGVPIPTKLLSLNGFSATEYNSSSSGQTVSGYAFSQMRGVMIPLSDSLSIEVNHFSPSGITADFAADDTLFNSIIKTFTYSASPSGVTPTVTPTPTIFMTISPMPTKVATSAGY